MNRTKKCIKNVKCNKEYEKCIPKNKNGTKKKINYWIYQNIYDCQYPILDKYYPPKKRRNYNPKYSKCLQKCNKKEYSKCKKQCNKTHPIYLIYKYGKLVDEIWTTPKKKSKSKKKKKSNSKNMFNYFL
jgi:hypothetical protein